MDGSRTLLDQYMPEYQVRTRHAIEIAADPRDVFDGARHGDFSESAALRWLFRLRGLPGTALSVDGMLTRRFVLLAEQSGREFVLGAVGRPWTPSGNLVRLGGAEFAAYREPGQAKMAWNFSVTQSSGAPVRLSTETRVLCTDEASLRKFKLYWRLVGPWSGRIRREILRGIKLRLERMVSFKETI